MYTCAAEFDFLELEVTCGCSAVCRWCLNQLIAALRLPQTPVRYLKTLLLPVNLLLLALIVWRVTSPFACQRHVVVVSFEPLQEAINAGFQSFC